MQRFYYTPYQVVGLQRERAVTRRCFLFVFLKFNNMKRERARKI